MTTASWLRWLVLIATASFVCVSGLSAQIALPAGPGQCGGVRDFAGARHETKAGSPTLPQPRRFTVLESGFCSEYSVSGWEQTMYLYLGEGASDYLPLVQSAVDLWNTSLVGFNRTPVIKIVHDLSPRTYGLQSNFWSNDGIQAAQLSGDGQSVIYFRGGGDLERVWSFAYRRWDGSSRMVEADIYINTTHEDEYGPDLVLTELIMNLDGESGVHALVSSTFLTIVHEIGHALGLNHLPVSGNIMSYRYMPRMTDIWRSPIAVLLISLFAGQSGSESEGVDYSSVPLVQRIDNVRPYMALSPDSDSDLVTVASLFTQTVALGEQDKMGLMCIYEFSDWNH